MKKWPRLTETAPFPVESFDRCQLCGRTVDDTVKIGFWQECDERDRPISDAVILVCKDPACHHAIEKHPRLYIEADYFGSITGGPGWWQIICDDCDYRRGTRCTHPDLKANGGEGLKVKMSGPSGFICGRPGGCQRMRPSAYQCTGKKVGGEGA